MKEALAGGVVQLLRARQAGGDEVRQGSQEPVDLRVESDLAG